MRPKAEAAHDADEPALRRAFLQGAGLDMSTPLTLNAAAMEHLGALLRAAADGTLEMLRDRAAVMHRLRADGGWPPVTRGTNPLHNALDVEEALRLLLPGPGRGGQHSPLDSLNEAYRELQSYHHALLAGVHAAAADLMAKLDPQALDAAEGPSGALDGWMPARREAALWRRHCTEFARLLDSLDAAVEAVLGREVARTVQATAGAAPGGAERPGGRSPPHAGRQGP